MPKFEIYKCCNEILTAAVRRLACTGRPWQAAHVARDLCATCAAVVTDQEEDFEAWLADRPELGVAFMRTPTGNIYFTAPLAVRGFCTSKATRFAI